MKTPKNSESQNSFLDLSETYSDNFVIVIGRKFGSGGRNIGKIISEVLGIDYYDSEILSKAAQIEGIDPKVFKDHEEKKPSVLKTLLQGAYGIADNFHTVPLSSERIYRSQCKVIKELCNKSSCVIVGRNADYILRYHPRLLSVFLHSPESNRIKRILSRGEAKDESEAKELARKHDRRRESFYNFYTGEKLWGVASNYHLSLDTSNLEDNFIADIIMAMAKTKFGLTGIKNIMQK